MPVSWPKVSSMTLLKAVLFLVSLHSSAWAMDMEVEESRTRSFLAVSGEGSQFTLEEGALSGSGVKVGFANSFTEKTTLGVFLSSALNTSGGASFTGLGGYVYYTLLGDCCTTVRKLQVDGRTLVTESSEGGQSLQVGFGLDQFFLNGSKSVYSSSGLGASLAYQFSLWSYRFKAEARHSQMTAGQNKIQGNFFSLGMVFDL